MQERNGYILRKAMPAVPNPGSYGLFAREIFPEASGRGRIVQGQRCGKIETGDGDVANRKTSAREAVPAIAFQLTCIWVARGGRVSQG